MYSHLMIGSNDLEKSRTFYDAVLGALGAKPGKMDFKGRLQYAHNGGRLMITTPINGEPATVANGNTIAFTVDGPEQGDAWHKAGVENGGTSIEDPPGIREAGEVRVYLAYLRDPDGHKLCALHRLP